MKGQRGKRCNSTMRLDPREEGGGRGGRRRSGQGGRSWRYA